MRARRPTAAPPALLARRRRDRLLWLALLAALAAGCGARRPVSAPAATEARSPEAGEAAPAAPADLGRRPPLVVPARAEIEQLDAEIAAWRDQLRLDPPTPDAITAAQGRPVPMAAAGCQAASETPSPSGAVCQDVCRLADSICGNAERICRLADQLAADTWAAERCASAKASCSAARDRCCSCR